MKNVVVVDHPLVQHKLSLMRRKDTPSSEFRRLLREVGPLLFYEATRDAPLDYRDIETPVATMHAPFLAGKKPCIVPVLRAGLGFADAMTDIAPFVRVGHLGVYRNPDTHEAVEYFYKMPKDIAARLVIVVDPMLATGNSATAALSRLSERGATRLKLICLVASPEGLQKVNAAFPDVMIYTAAVDDGLTEHAYITPGLGDAGDRLFGTE
jgi:uracil phosphoribosyltransferase